jgi:uncharacterized cupin superfamily protein
VHWDDVASTRLDRGHLGSTWRDLGTAAGTVTAGVRRIEIDAARFSTPVHVHSVDEEIFFVLGGSGLLWQDGRTCELGPGDCVVHRARAETHTLRGGEDGLDVLAFGQRREPGLTQLPRAGAYWGRPGWLPFPAGDDPWTREAAAGPPECPPPAERPANVVALGDGPAAFGGAARASGRGGGAVTSGLNHVTLAAGSTGAPPHCHSLEEEIFVVLEGTATLLLHPQGDGDPEEHPLRAGHVVARPAGTGVSHALRAGPDGVVYLAYGTREPNDMTWYPEVGKVALRGLGVSFFPDRG